MPIYKIAFRPRAAKAFKKLDAGLQQQIAKKLIERQANPKIAADAVREIRSGFKIKLRASGVRLIYMVHDDILTILILAVGKREGEDAYTEAIREFRNLND